MKTLIITLALVLTALVPLAPQAFAQDEPAFEIVPLDPVAVFQDIAAQASMLFERGELDAQIVLAVNDLRKDMNAHLAAIEGDMQSSTQKVHKAEGDMRRAHLMALKDLVRMREQVAFAYLEELRILMDEGLAAKAGDGQETSAAPAKPHKTTKREQAEPLPQVSFAPEDISTGARE